MWRGRGWYFFLRQEFCRWGSDGSGEVFFRAGKCESFPDRLWYDGNVSPYLGCFQAEGWHRTPRRGDARWAHGGTEGLFMRPPSTAVTATLSLLPRRLVGDAQIFPFVYAISV